MHSIPVYWTQIKQQASRDYRGSSLTITDAMDTTRTRTVQNKRTGQAALHDGWHAGLHVQAVTGDTRAQAHRRAQERVLALPPSLPPDGSACRRRRCSRYSRAAGPSVVAAVPTMVVPKAEKMKINRGLGRSAWTARCVRAAHREDRCSAGERGAQQMARARTAKAGRRMGRDGPSARARTRVPVGAPSISMRNLMRASTLWSLSHHCARLRYQGVGGESRAREGRWQLGS